MLADLALYVTSATAVASSMIAARMHHRLRHDPLTGLPNRAALQARFRRVRRVGSGFVAVAVADMNGFKALNDTHGHRFGDQVLRAVSDAFRATAGRGELPVRLHGDEFAVLLTGPDRAQLEARAEEFQDAVSAIRQVNGQPVELGVAIGVLAAPARTLDLSALLGSADDRMYGDKHCCASSNVMTYESERQGQGSPA